LHLQLHVGDIARSIEGSSRDPHVEKYLNPRVEMHRPQPSGA